MPVVNAAALSKMFSRTVIRELTANGESTALARRMSQSGVFSASHQDCTLSQAFDQAYQILEKRGLRDDYVYRNAVVRKKLLGHHTLNTASMLSEFSIGMSRADLVLLNGTAMVYELKSERDSLTRLQGQMDDYRRVFAAATVLTDQKHLLKVEKLVDASVGLAVLTARGRISEIRPAAPTPERIDPSAVLDALRLQEALDVLRRMEIEAPDTTNTKIRGCIRSLFKGIDPVELHSALVEVLKSSRSLSPLKQLIPSLPDSLIAAVLPLGFKKESQWEKLLGSMETPLAEVMKWK